jgi:hypothetical protein
VHLVLGRKLVTRRVDQLVAYCLVADGERPLHRRMRPRELRFQAGARMLLIAELG